MLTFSLFIPWLTEKVAGGSSQKEKLKTEGQYCRAEFSRYKCQAGGSGRCGKPGPGERLHQLVWLATLITRAMLVWSALSGKED